VLINIFYPPVAVGLKTMLKVCFNDCDKKSSKTLSICSLEEKGDGGLLRKEMSWSYFAAALIDSPLFFCGSSSAFYLIAISTFDVPDVAGAAN